MPVKAVNEKYRCNVCGNEVIVTVVGGGILVCCGEDMELIGPKKGKSYLEEGYELDEEEDEDEEEEEDEEEDEEEEDE